MIFYEHLSWEDFESLNVLPLLFQAGVSLRVEGNGETHATLRWWEDKADRREDQVVERKARMQEDKSINSIMMTSMVQDSMDMDPW